MFSPCSQSSFACEQSPIYKRRHKTLAQTLGLADHAPKNAQIGRTSRLPVLCIGKSVLGTDKLEAGTGKLTLTLISVAAHLELSPSVNRWERLVFSENRPVNGWIRLIS
jgi:hypothetical protein